MNVEILQALAVTAELTQTQLSTAALDVLANDLSSFSTHKVLKALDSCRKEIQPGKMTYAAILDRIEDGRPKADEAWSIALMAMDEYETVVMNDEISEAYGVARPIHQSGDEVGARMAFRSAYERITRDKKGTPVRWWPSFGEDKSRRDQALIQAVQLGRLPAPYANQFLPSPVNDEGVLLLTAK